MTKFGRSNMNREPYFFQSKNKFSCCVVLIYWIVLQNQEMPMDSLGICDTVGVISKCLIEVCAHK